MNDTYNWASEYSVGNRTLDAQHQKLLQICKQVSTYRCDGSKSSISAFHLILNDLALYASQHFDFEEEILRRTGYTKLDEQKDDHDTYREHLVHFLYDASAGKVDNKALEDFLGKWWVNHILLSDMQYASHLANS